MGCKFIFKRIFLVALLSVAGLFGISSIVVNKQTQEASTVELANAELDPTGNYRYVFFANCHGSWANGDSRLTSLPTTAQAIANESLAIWYTYWKDGDSDSTKDSRIVPIASDNQYTEVLSDKFNIKKRDGSSNYNNKTVVRIMIPKDYGYIRFCNRVKIYWWGSGNWSQTEKFTISTSSDNLLCVIDSGGTVAGDDNYGYWTLPLLTKSYTGTTDTLLFAPNNNWRTSTHYSHTIYPSIYIQWYDHGIICQNADWPGVNHSSVSNEIYSFNNIPLTDLRQLTILFNNEVDYSGSGQSSIPRLDFNSASRLLWWNKNTSTHSKNLFGMTNDNNYIYSTDTPVDVKSDYYDSGTNAIIVGSFMFDGLSDWNTSFSEAHRLVGSSSPFTCTIDVAKGDEFKYVLNALKNTSSSGNASSYSLAGGDNSVDYHGYSTTNVLVYDGDEEHQVTTNYSQFLGGTDGNNISFNKSGRVTFKRTTTASNVLTIKVIFLEHTYISTNYYIVGYGSFVNNNMRWSTFGGVNLKNINGYKVSTDQYFEAEDTFQIKDSSQGASEGWYGWSNFDSADKTTYFHQAYYNMYTISETPQWGATLTPTAGNYTKANGGSGYIGKVRDDIYIKAPTWFYTYDCSSLGLYWWIGNTDSGNISFEPNDYIDTDGDYRIYKAKDVPTNISGFIIRRYGTDTEHEDSKTADKTLQGNNNIITSNSGYFHVHVDSNNRLFIKNLSLNGTFTPGTSLYLDVNGKWGSSDVPKVHIWNTDHTDEAQDVTMNLVHNYDRSETLWEVVIPSFASGNPNKVIFYHNNWGDHTADLSYDSGTNVFVITEAKNNSSSGEWHYFIKDVERIDFYGKYFNSLTDGEKGGCCDGNGDTDITALKSCWSSLYDEYTHLNTSVQEAIEGASSSGVEEINLAVARYDYIVISKHYTELVVRETIDKTDYLGRMPPNAKANGSISNIRTYLGLEDESNQTIILIIVFSCIAILSMTTLSVLLVKKRKSE